MSGMSVSQFGRRFRRAFGSSPHQYLLRLRVNAAARLLIETSQTIAAIAQDCGFHDHAHLCRNFGKIMNVTPSTFRSRQKEYKKS
ncbi:MAG: helix-turn-helix transcriptional regulator [Opitutae bacterium]|nr:helix-turn-helix transcriptional regulator [Opitutae bacterium]